LTWSTGLRFRNPRLRILGVRAHSKNCRTCGRYNEQFHPSLLSIRFLLQLSKLKRVPRVRRVQRSFDIAQPWDLVGIKVLTKNKPHRIAVNIAKLPELLGKWAGRWLTSTRHPRPQRLPWPVSGRVQIQPSRWREIDAPADLLAVSRNCGSDDHRRSGVGPISNVLSLVLARHQGGPRQLLLCKQGTMPADDFRKRRLLHPEPVVSAASDGPRPDALMIEPMAAPR
jgi:hypothetical protein